MVNFTILASGYAAVMTAFNFDSDSKTISIINTTPNENSPSWLAAGPGGSVFAALETTPGGVESFTVDQDFSFKNVSRTDSAGIPVTLAVLKGGKELVTANYDTGLVVSYPIDSDGVTLGDGINGTTLVGSGPVAGRQDSPHPHHIIEYNNEILISDLGSDMVWRLQKADNGSYELAGKIAQKPGSGPRHIAASNGKLFVAAELSNTLSYYKLQDQPDAHVPRSAKWRRFCANNTDPTPEVSDQNFVGSLSVLPTDPPAGATWGAGEILLSPDEKYIYVSNRNVGTTDERGDPIAIFSADPFKLIGHTYTGLTAVRGMIFGGDAQDPTKYLMAAGQVSGGLVIFERDADGNLTEVSRYANHKNDTKGISTLLWRLPEA